MIGRDPATRQTIGEIQRERNIPVVGNGDILTWYEHRQRIDVSGASASMVGRGALIKPWIFKEVAEVGVCRVSIRILGACRVSICVLFYTHAYFPSRLLGGLKL